MGEAKLEQELKLQVPADFVLPDLEGFEELSHDVRRLHAIYWDTPGLALGVLGHSLRARRADDGSEAGWTLKLAEGGSDVAVRREVNLPDDALTPPTAALDLVRGVIGHEALGPVAVIDTERGRSRLRHVASGAVVEVDDDLVTSELDGAAGPSFREIEIEALEGDAGTALDAAGKLLRRAGAPRSEPTPKLLRVLGERVTASALAEPGRAPKTVGELVSQAIRAGTRQLLTYDPSIRLDGEGEAVHKARVATRRLRSDLKSLAPWCDEFRIEGLRRELQWLGSMLGQVRDTDVLGTMLQAVAADAGGIDGGAMACLNQRLRAERAASMVVLGDAIRSSRYHGLVADLRRLTANPPLGADVSGDDPVKPVARQLVARADHRVRRHVDALGDPPQPAELHEVRKAAKRARYAAELVASIAGDKTTRLARRLAGLQDELGRYQDAVTLIAWLDDLPAKRPTVAEAYVAGILRRAVEEQVRAGTAWRKAWRKASEPGLRRWFD
jgi:CHAD domain-containing protein